MIFKMEDDSDYSDLSMLSSDSDDEELLNNIVDIRQNNQNYLQLIVPNYNDQEFLEHFRLSRDTAETLAERFQTSQYYTNYSGQYGKISAKDQLYVYLWYVGHQTASFRDVADRFDISKSSLERIIVRLTYFLSNMSNVIITWADNEEKANIERHFRENGFPGVVGVIDGSHIKIDKPETDPDSYLNRKGFYSIQVNINTYLFIELMVFK